MKGDGELGGESAASAGGRRRVTVHPKVSYAPTRPRPNTPRASGHYARALINLGTLVPRG